MTVFSTHCNLSCKKIGGAQKLGHTSEEVSLPEKRSYVLGERNTSIVLFPTFCEIDFEEV